MLTVAPKTHPNEVPLRLALNLRRSLRQVIALKRLSLLPAVAIGLWSTAAFADKVAVLPFLPAADFVNREQTEEVRNATKLAVTQRQHTNASDSELATAVTAVQDGVADTSAEYKVAGKAATSQWTVVAHVSFRNGYWHLEVEACLVDTGRVESLTRDVDPRVAPQQIGEMLTLLLRPEGIGNADVPWANQTLPPILPDKPKDPPKPPPAVKHDYAEKFPIGIGAGIGINGAFVRPENAVGSSLSLFGLITGEYAIERVPGLAIRANLGGAFYNNPTFTLDAGARYAIPLVPTARLYFGPEVTLGVFVPIAGDKSPRFLLRTDVFVSLGLGERVQLEVAFDLQSAFGGDRALVLGGGLARGLVRF
jgi:hypothetical protein